MIVLTVVKAPDLNGCQSPGSGLALDDVARRASNLLPGDLDAFVGVGRGDRSCLAGYDIDRDDVIAALALDRSCFVHIIGSRAELQLQRLRGP